jgi:hypothetical protein
MWRQPSLYLVFFCFALLTILFLQSAFLASAGGQERFWSRQNVLKHMSSLNNQSPTSIGGGAVNEKKRLYPERLTGKPTRDGGNVETATSSSYDPVRHRSHFLHAMEGLDRYPNYLSRWKEGDMDRLETALREKLSQVRDQRSQVMRQRDEMQQILHLYLQQNPQWNKFVQIPATWEEIQSNILDPRASKVIFRSKFFQSTRGESTISVQDVLQGKTPVNLDTALLQDLMDEEMFDTYSLPLLSPEFCYKLHRFVSAFSIHVLDSSLFQQSLTLNIHKDLDNMGMGWLNDLIFQLVVRPISCHLYKETELEGGDLDWRQGFIASYSADPTQSKPRQRLVPHTDDSEVSWNQKLLCKTSQKHGFPYLIFLSPLKITLNVCLGDKFEGGDIRFWGLRGENVKGNKILGEYQPEVGRAIIHSGRHLHEVTTVTAGDRFALILWTRSWKCARKEVCPCCWLNRRRGSAGGSADSCVCGPRWN